MFQTPHGNWNHTSMEGQPKKQKLGIFPSNRTLSIPEWFQPTLFLIRTLLMFLHQLLYHLSPLQRWLSMFVKSSVCEDFETNASCSGASYMHSMPREQRYWSAVILLVGKWYISVGCSVLLKFQYGFVLSKHMSTLPSQDCLAVCVVWGVYPGNPGNSWHTLQTGILLLKKNFQWKSLPFKTAWLTVPVRGTMVTMVTANTHYPNMDTAR